ncbi:integral membrane sensor signal transduction histidine kinase [Candidatus Magnetobacterium bavaricum]|uniref:histidine kinase n=1 Tax=Candidatus Magnetobacterium bavaricum TaxID=29290 RepID=A0A0F3GUF5_9BACT|nr:integral membrane sensor signal transduction histidine kinase [Candidatus Magnetobacterium bavaricum]
MFLSIKSKILISHFGVVLLVGIAIGASSIYFISTHLNVDEMKHLQFMAKMMRFRILEGIANKTSMLQRILEGREVEFYIEKYQEPVLVQFFARFSKEFPVLSYIDATGTELEEVVKVVHGKTSTGDSKIRDISILKKITTEPDKVIISDVQNNTELGKLALDFILPKYSFFGDKIVGFIKGSVPLSDITNVLSGVEVGDTGFFLLLSNEGKIIYPDSKHKTIGKLIDHVINRTDLITKPASLTKGINRASVLGIDSVVVSIAIEEVNWSLLIAVPYSEFIAEANKVKYITFGILIIVLIISGVIFTFITNNITNNILNPLKRFIAFTDMISVGDYSQIIGISSKDEIGVLAKSFNNMLIELKKTQQTRDMHLKKLETTNEYLKQSQAQLVQAEKMASLGQLVAGVAHEINTPVGIGITLSSTIVKTTGDIMAAFNNKSLNKTQLEQYINEIGEGSSVILTNLLRAADLIKRFKMVSTDQLTQDRRKFKIKEYLEEILISLKPTLKRHPHNIEIKCPEDLEMDSYPGALAQIMTNLLLNSCIHAYDPDDKGDIIIEVIDKEREIVVEYSDDGKGMSTENLKRVFEPFFTTRRGSGGTGLGLHIVYNIVTQTFGGHIECKSVEGEGTRFIITFSASAKETA